MRIRFAHGAFYAAVMVLATWAQAAGTPTGYVFHDLLAPGHTFQGINAATSTGQVGYAAGGFSHAGMWSGTAPSFVDLHPAGYDASYGSAAGAGTQAGTISGPLTGGNAHAAVWFGSAASVVDLHPAGFTSSAVSGAGGNQQVGAADVDNKNYAALWTGSAASFVNLHPAGFEQSYAYGTSGTQQVGYADDADGHSHAMLWSGTAASTVDLTPATSGLGGWLNAASGGQQVGAAYDRTVANAPARASIWSGTPQSRVDLAAAHWTYSEAYATNGTQQVGWALMPGEDWEVGFVWSGTAESAVDLGPFIPAEYFGIVPTAITDDGTIFGTAKFANVNRPFMLVPSVPEPSTAAIFLLAGATLCRRGRRRTTPAAASGCCPARS